MIESYSAQRKRVGGILTTKSGDHKETEATKKRSKIRFGGVHLLRVNGEADQEPYRLVTRRKEFGEKIGYGIAKVN